MNVLAENHEVEEELAMVSKVNTELNNYMALSEKIAEDRERKRIAREIHDTLGACANRNLGRLRCCRSLD